VYFTTALRSNEAVLEKLLRTELIKKYPEDAELLEDVIVENKQAIEMANIYSGILSGMMDAFASVISNNLNIVMKVLAIVTIVMAIPTMIFSAYGMNVNAAGMPFAQSPHGFVIIIGLAAAVSVLGPIFRPAGRDPVRKRAPARGTAVPRAGAEFFCGEGERRARRFQSVRPAQSAGAPESICSPWARVGSTASKFSFAPRGEPGRLRMRLRPRMPA
jgi:hypothetical protein